MVSASIRFDNPDQKATALSMVMALFEAAACQNLGLIIEIRVGSLVVELVCLPSDFRRIVAAFWFGELPAYVTEIAPLMESARAYRAVLAQLSKNTSDGKLSGQLAAEDLKWKEAMSRVVEVKRNESKNRGAG
jgi:hypothetical protein